MDWSRRALVKLLFQIHPPTLLNTEKEMKLPRSGRYLDVKYSNIVCKRGIANNLELYNWYNDIIDGKINSSRKTISIFMLDELGNEAVRRDFANAWPSKYDPPDKNATGNSIAIETLEIVHEGELRTK